jgi:hypothetical protein
MAEWDRVDRALMDHHVKTMSVRILMRFLRMSMALQSHTVGSSQLTLPVQPSEPGFFELIAGGTCRFLASSLL